MSDNPSLIIVLLVCLAVSILVLVAATHKDAKESAYAVIEKKCLYGERLEFSGQMFSCQWLPEVTTTDKQYSVKPHPNKEVLK